MTTEEHNETWGVAGRLRRSRGDHQRRRPRVELGSQARRPGLGSVWFAQMASYDALAVASAVGRAVPRISVGTAVVSIYPRHPQILASAAKTAQAATGGRFQLKGRTLGDADAAVTVTQSRVHGHGTISRSAPFVSARPTTGITHSDQQRRHRSSKPAHNAGSVRLTSASAALAPARRWSNSASAASAGWKLPQRDCLLEITSRRQLRQALPGSGRDGPMA